VRLATDMPKSSCAGSSKAPRRRRRRFDGCPRYAHDRTRAFLSAATGCAPRRPSCLHLRHRSRVSNVSIGRGKNPHTRGDRPAFSRKGPMWRKCVCRLARVKLIRRRTRTPGRATYSRETLIALSIAPAATRSGARRPNSGRVVGMGLERRRAAYRASGRRLFGV